MMAVFGGFASVHGALALIGVAGFVAVNFACYYVSTRLAVRKAGLPQMALRYYLQGFIGMVLAALVVAVIVHVVMGAIA